MKNSYTAKTLKGLEDILAQELKDLGAKNCRIGRRLVHFEGDLELLYRTNLNCRTAITILKPVFSFTFRDEPDFYKKLRAINWEKYISLEQVFLIRSTVFSDHFNHTKFPALRMKDALADWFVDKYKKRPSVDVDNPSIVFDLHISDNRATVSLDSSGDLLYKRGYRIDGWKAPLNEVLAAGMILLSNWDQKSEFLNPMSGSGTLAIEAAMIAAKIPANYRRATFGFHFWPDFDPFIWRKVFDQSVAQIQNELDFPILGVDQVSLAAKIGQQNASAAGVSRMIDFEIGDFATYFPSTGQGVVMINPPYGHRMKEDEIDQLYSRIGDYLKQHCAGMTAWIFTANREASKHVGLRPSNKIGLFNGKLDSVWLRYDLYKGSKKSKYSNDKT